jgi:hypothetical protein
MVDESWVSQRNAARHGTVSPVTSRAVIHTPTAWLRTSIDQPAKTE